MLLFKIVFINIILSIHSIRKTCIEIQVNLAYHWFLGIAMYENVPNYSTWSQNYIRHYGDSEVFDQIFEPILKQAIQYGFVDLETVFGDFTYQKASANKNKYSNEEIEIAKKICDEELLEEINKDRVAHGKKNFKQLEKKELRFDEETKTKHIKVLSYSTVNRSGYKEYKSNPEDWRKIYPLRKVSIESVFGYCKEHHNLRYTRLRGLKKNQRQTLMLFACHNLKRMARWRWEALLLFVQE